MHCARDSGSGKGVMDGVRPKRGVARPIAFAIPSGQASGIASLQRPIAAEIAAASRVRNGAPAAAEMPPASGEVSAAEVTTATEMPAATEMTSATMSATAAMAATTAVAATTSSGCIDGG
jgi:hypothetical protein